MAFGAIVRLLPTVETGNSPSVCLRCPVNSPKQRFPRHLDVRELHIDVVGGESRLNLATGVAPRLPCRVADFAIGSDGDGAARPGGNAAPDVGVTHTHGVCHGVIARYVAVVAPFAHVPNGPECCKMDSGIITVVARLLPFRSMPCLATNPLLNVGIFVVPAMTDRTAWRSRRRAIDPDRLRPEENGLPVLRIESVGSCFT